jgi:hypothetical protein
MRWRPHPWLVRGSIAALAATTAYGVVAVALQVPLSVVNAAADDPVGFGEHHHHHAVDAEHLPGQAHPDHFDCCVARLASAGAAAIEPTEPPVPVAAVERPRWHPRLQPPRARPWRASLGRHPPVVDHDRLARCASGAHRSQRRAAETVACFRGSIGPLRARAAETLACLRGSIGPLRARSG